MGPQADGSPYTCSPENRDYCRRSLRSRYPTVLGVRERPSLNTRLFLQLEGVGTGGAGAAARCSGRAI